MPPRRDAETGNRDGRLPSAPTGDYQERKVSRLKVRASERNGKRLNQATKVDKGSLPPKQAELTNLWDCKQQGLSALDAPGCLERRSPKMGAVDETGDLRQIPAIPVHF